MSLSRLALAAIGAGAVGVALVGVGAGATFTDSTTSTQTVNAGTLQMSVYAAGANGCTSAADHCSSLTLPGVGPEGSTFDTPATQVFVKNTGNIPATFNAFQMSVAPTSTAKDTALLDETNVCITSYDSSAANQNPAYWVEGNGPLTTAVALNPTVKENGVTVNPGQTVWYTVSFYAGQDSAVCGQKVSDGSNTTAAWTGYDGHGYETPASLNNDAQGGSITPTLTFSFTG